VHIYHSAFQHALHSLTSRNGQDSEKQGYRAVLVGTHDKFGVILEGILKKTFLILVNRLLKHLLLFCLGHKPIKRKAKLKKTKLFSIIGSPYNMYIRNMMIPDKRARLNKRKNNANIFYDVNFLSLNSMKLRITAVTKCCRAFIESVADCGGAESRRLLCMRRREPIRSLSCRPLSESSAANKQNCR